MEFDNIRHRGIEKEKAERVRNIVQSQNKKHFGVIC